MSIDNQELFISSEASWIRCVAGPGTGKTWAMQKRIGRLLNEDKTLGSRIFAVTFTRHAAAQLKNNLTGLDVPGTESIHASTLHSFAFKILRLEGAIEALGRYPRPCFEFELDPFFHDVSGGFRGVKECREKLNALDAMWARLQSEEPGWPLDPTDKKFHQAYLSWMRFHGALHIGELIPLAVQFLKQNPVNDIRDSFDYVLVDEYQDFNKADQTLIGLIGEKSEIAIVGDDDQSIYAFRYAHPEGIRIWLDDKPDPNDDVTLELCRRCDGNILSIANHLINQNPERLRGDLAPLPEKKDSGEIKILQWNTRKNETQGIAKVIQELINDEEIPEGETILVLVPRHEFVRNLLEKLQELGVEDVKIHAKPQWGDKELSECLTILTLLENPEDLVALRYWLGLGDDSWRKKEYARLRNACGDGGKTPSELLQDHVACKELKIPKLEKRWKELQTKLDALVGIDESGLLDQLLPLKGKTKEFGEIIRKLREEDTEERTLNELLIQAVLSPVDESIDGRINIMTYHRAKGLTCHTVIVTSLVNGILPSKPNPQTPQEHAKLQEDRRLLFVAITRAKSRVILSSFRKVTVGENMRLKLGLQGWGHWQDTQASRFLSELGPDTPEAIQYDKKD